MSRAISMRKIREILRLALGQGVSARQVARACGVARSTVAEYLRRAEQAGLCWPLPDELDEAGLEQLLMAPEKGSTGPLPDLAAMEQELRRPGVTRQLLWEEYRQNHPEGLSYSRFCFHLRDHLAASHPTMRLDHKAGEEVQVDFAGQTMPITCRLTGEVTQVQIFVACLPASAYLYAEAVPDQSLEHWLGAHVRTFQAIGGVPAIVRPDNLKSAVSRACRYDPEVNRAYAELAEHYGVAVIPTRVRRPRDKASVETHVGIVERQILARLRDQSFFSIDELNEAIWQELDRVNAAAMQKKAGSRDERFVAIDQPALAPLPRQPYRFAQWKSAKVHRDYHIEVQHHYYSVPHALIGQQVDVRFNKSTVEVFHRGSRVAAHRASTIRGGHTTVPAHMPKAHQRSGMRPEELIGRARGIGPAVAEWVEQAMQRRRHPEQGYRSAMGVLRLASEYGASRLDAACKKALELGSFRYGSIASMLKKGLERTTPAEACPLPAHANVRGPGYYH